MVPDYYAVLHLTPDASFEEVHRAYRALALRYHPDVNAAPEAASSMAAINEAYSVLGEPVRRRRYDRDRNATPGNAMTPSILAAARESLLKHRWAVLRDDGTHMLLENGSRRVRVSLVDRVTNAMVRKLAREWTGFAVVLALELESPMNLALQTTVIDLLHSRKYGADFPDETYAKLFLGFYGS
jgi:curved DNA-binding protein CbpA